MVAGAADKQQQVNKSQIDSTFGQLLLYFIENQGQIADESVRYYVKGSDKSLYFTK